jgi:hypothetical protein
LEVDPPPSLAKPPIEITPSPAKKPAPVPPPPPQRPAAPPPAAGAQQPDTDFDFSSTGFDSEFLDQIFNDATEQPFFDDFFDNQVSLTLRNTLEVPACFVYISPTDNDEWGNDWLSEDEFILPGDTRTFNLEPNQVVDISALDCDGFVLHEEYGISISNQEVEIALDSIP